eukprot:894355-Rhodomonas_salina.1
MMVLVTGYTVVLCWTGPKPEEGSEERNVLRACTIALLVVCVAEAGLKVSGFGIRYRYLHPYLPTDLEKNCAVLSTSTTCLRVMMQRAFGSRNKVARVITTCVLGSD